MKKKVVIIVMIISAILIIYQQYKIRHYQAFVLDNASNSLAIIRNDLSIQNELLASVIDSGELKVLNLEGISSSYVDAAQQFSILEGFYSFFHKERYEERLKSGVITPDNFLVGISNLISLWSAEMNRHKIYDSYSLNEAQINDLKTLRKMNLEYMNAIDQMDKYIKGSNELVSLVNTFDRVSAEYKTIYINNQFLFIP